MKSVLNFSKFKWIATAIVVVAVLFFGKDVLANFKLNQGQIKNESLFSNLTYLSEPLDTFPKFGEVIHIQKHTNDKSVKLSIENGEVTNLEIDGEQIDKADYDKYKDVIEEVKPRSGNFGDSRFFMFGDDAKGRFGFDHMKLFNDSLSNKWDDNFFNGFESRNFDQMLAEMRKQFDRFNTNDLLDSMFLNFKNFQGQGFNFNFPNQIDRGIWIEDSEDEYHNSKNRKDVNLTDILGAALNYDGMLLPGESNKVELTGKYLKINGEKQPNNIFQKYKRILEEESGIELNKNSKLQFNLEGKTSKRKYRSF